ncbi:VWA domain-containing protein [Myxococcus llanfairpwllgwyngyllgogerychwyrndrobwllllantysiliogogogochensis]|uniref:VWA domain-containing protein n=1 Tax=Myxococcus llanfairpwllgwyngyllgogerychwyrndrobwllllantysiliogogogochensis TaxID=2590453 RepID=A0A540X9B7_9BACT|nr:VWA domain-containing protein [Myxococcus llanfairpwllgwyngyllgogerychwyrndrobwllllantysiliogogogochensis]TQF17822.1 VWA domain-containing protein [Myxococcus llanfairpwllgwyngyllgogerychwyrndrobwllllantysiliogogogochensis]
MTFSLPQAWVLLLPLGLFLWKFGRRPGPPMWLRAALLVLTVGALSGPELRRADAGSDVVVVVDRSASMPRDIDRTAQELVSHLESQRRPGDRVGVIVFGREPRVEQPLSSGGAFGGFTRPVDAESSDLSAALDAANALIPQERTGRVLVLSDGRATGTDARGSARRLAARGIAVDWRQLARPEPPLDVAVVSLDVPTAVSSREPFQFSASVYASSAVTGTVRLERNGRVLVKGPFDFQPGPNVLPLRDLIEEPGLARYQLTVEVPGDGVVENDKGLAVLRVEGPRRVLLVTNQPKGTLAKALEATGLVLEVRAPFRLTLDDLDGVGSVVLENVDANTLGEPGLNALAAYVEQAGGGLVMTGGRESFGEGGYRRSPVEPLLPVSLEMREEQRRASIAISILMDCSCSMGATVPDGRTKMEVAAEGVVAALTLLNPQDEASVHMVDTETHEIFPLRSVQAGLPYDKVAKGFSGGGGIYVGEALRTGRKQIFKSEKPTRHVLLFSDAADSEEPDDYRRTLSELQGEGVTVSVIGLGTPKDVDAALLKEVAQRGGGRIYFAEDAMSLPRIFSQETLAVARATFIDEPVSVEAAPDLPLLGKLPSEGLPQVGGYNLTYLRPRASVALRTLDTHAAPLLAMWPRGAGRTVAFTAEVDGPFTGELRQWGSLRATLEAMVRWTLAGSSPLGEAVVRSERRGHLLRVTLDLPPDEPLPATLPTLMLLSGDGTSAPTEHPMRWEEDDRLVAELPLEGSGTWHPVVRVGTRALRAPPVALPYAPEFEPGSPKEGLALLRAVAAVGGGVERLSMTGLFEEAPESEGHLALAPWLVALAVAVLLSEVAVRRFLSAPRQRVKARAVSEASVAGSVLAPSSPVPSTVTSVTSAPAAPEAGPRAPEGEAKPKEGGVDSALEAARARSRRRLDR